MCATKDSHCHHIRVKKSQRINNKITLEEKNSETAITKTFTDFVRRKNLQQELQALYVNTCTEAFYSAYTSSQQNYTDQSARKNRAQFYPKSPATKQP
jgi:hypothetical protein